MASGKKVSKSSKTTSKPKVKRKRVSLSFKAEPGSDVYVAGSFNGWNPSGKKMKEKDPGEYAITMLLPEGDYEYKFVLDGRWQADPSSEKWAPNPYGSLNSVLKVRA